MRSFLADYGVPLMVIVWTAVSYALQSATPGGIPRRLALPNTWDAAAKRNYGVLLDLGECSGAQIAYAVIPAAIIALLFYFDHNVSAQLAQQKDFQLVRPPAYHWDMSVVALLMVRRLRPLLFSLRASHAPRTALVPSSRVHRSAAHVASLRSHVTTRLLACPGLGAQCARLAVPPRPASVSTKSTAVLAERAPCARLYRFFVRVALVCT